VHEQNLAAASGSWALPPDTLLSRDDLAAAHQVAARGEATAL
jgi:hypothetical protein